MDPTIQAFVDSFGNATDWSMQFLGAFLAGLLILSLIMFVIARLSNQN